MKSLKEKLLTALFFTVFTVISLSVFTAAQDLVIRLQIGSTQMSVNDTVKEIDAAPVIIDGRTLLPIRAVVEEMGGEVEWDGQAKQAALKSGDSTIVLTIDSSSALLNDEVQTLDVAPQIINGRTFLPIRFIAEGFGYSVDWDESAKEITISASDTEQAAASAEAAQAETEQAASSNTEQPTAEQITEVTTLAAAAAAAQSQPTEDSRVLVAYFSATGNTRQIAEAISSELNADLYEITPAQSYSDGDLNYSDDNSRVSKEHSDSSARPEIADSVENMEQYSTVFVGYPICDCVKLGLKNI